MSDMSKDDRKQLERLIKPLSPADRQKTASVLKRVAKLYDGGMLADVPDGLRPNILEVIPTLDMPTKELIDRTFLVNHRSETIRYIETGKL